MPENTADQRTMAQWRARACAAAAASGAQIFCFGAGIAIPLSLNAAWLCALPAAVLCALLAARVSRVRAQRAGMAAWRALLLAALMLGSCLFMTASAVSLCVQTLLPQARAISCAMLTLSFLLFAAFQRMKGVSRLCFALRIALPAGIAVCALAILPRGASAGLYPLMGEGAGALALGAAAMTGAAAPAMMLLLPAPERADRTPGAGFFALRVGLGALCGAAALLLPALLGGYETLRGKDVWGMRLRLAAVSGTQQSLWQTALLLLELCAMFLGACALLCAAEDALLLALPRLARRRAGLLACGALLAAALFGLTAYGYSAALHAAPALALPIPILLLPAGKRAKNNARKQRKEAGA